MDATLKPLTSFRFLAAMLVFLSHLEYFRNHETLIALFDHCFSEGYLGVSFFFVLSGFILTYNYHHRFTTITADTLKKFYLSRIARIYPVHILTFVITIPLVIHQIGQSDISHATIKFMLSGILNLTLLQSFFPVGGIHFSWNFPSWSLSDEIFFYLLIPGILYQASKHKITNNTIKPTIIAVAAYSLLAGLAFTMKDTEKAKWLFYVFPVSRLVDFIIGICLCMIFLKNPAKHSSITLFTLLEAAAIAGLCLAIYNFSAVHKTFRYGVYYLPFMSAIILIFAYQAGLISRILSNQKLVFLGEASFSFYMLHQLFIRYSELAGFDKTHPITNALLVFFITLISSSLLFLYFETPAKDRIRALLKNH